MYKRRKGKETMAKKEKEAVAGRDYKGFSATKCRRGTWHDLHNSHDPITYYRLELDTPCDMGYSEKIVQQYVIDSLSDIFCDIAILSHNESNKRAFKKEKGQFLYNCFGCILEQNWTGNKWTATLFLHNNFTGFPADNSDLLDDEMEV